MWWWLPVSVETSRKQIYVLLSICTKCQISYLLFVYASSDSPPLSNCGGGIALSLSLSIYIYICVCVCVCVCAVFNDTKSPFDLTTIRRRRTISETQIRPRYSHVTHPAGRGKNWSQFFSFFFFCMNASICLTADVETCVLCPRCMNTGATNGGVVRGVQNQVCTPSIGILWVQALDQNMMGRIYRYQFSRLS